MRTLLATAGVALAAVAVQPVAVAGGASACGYGNLDFSSLAGVDYRVVNPQTNDVYRLAVCGALSPAASPCYNVTDSPHQSVCLETTIPPSDVADWSAPQWSITNYGAPNQFISYMIMSEDNSCQVGWRDYHQYQTQVSFVCAAQAGEPKYVEAQQPCGYNFEIPTPLACPQSALVKAQAAHAVDPSESCEDRCTEGEAQAMQACGSNLQCIESVQAGANLCLAKCPQSVSVKVRKSHATNPAESCEDRCEEGSGQAMQACGSNLQCIEGVQASVNICLGKCLKQSHSMAKSVAPKALKSRVGAASQCAYNSQYDFTSLQGLQSLVSDDSTNALYYVRICSALYPKPQTPCANSSYPLASICMQPSNPRLQATLPDLGDWSEETSSSWSMASGTNQPQTFTYTLTSTPVSATEADLYGETTVGACVMYKTSISFVCATAQGSMTLVSTTECVRSFALPTPLACPPAAAVHSSESSASGAKNRVASKLARMRHSQAPKRIALH